MLRFIPDLGKRRRLRLLCIGAHSDDLEIGCGATVLTWLASMPSVEVTWLVLSAEGDRAVEARNSARALLARATASQIIIADFQDCFMQSQYADVKARFEDVKKEVDPDVILTHCLHDRHQDHRLAAELTWNTWRNHLVLEYEIPKYEGDLVTPNAYVPISAPVVRRKIAHLKRFFGSQRSKDWFSDDTFRGLMRIRGLESRSRSGFAEAFHARKLVI
jgi:LmbE family N-acetylglucosaminyl deacetylase